MATPPPPGPQPPQGQYPPPPGAAAPYPQQYPPSYPAPAYPAAPQPQPWAPGNAGFNGLAIVALVFGVLCFLPLAGVVFGVFALAQIKKRGQRGREMAVSGIVLSGFGAVVMALTLATGGAEDTWDGFREAASENGSTFSVAKGECFNSPSGSLEGYAYDVDTVPCRGEHDAEVFANFHVADGDWPGDTAVTEIADGKCYTLADAYVLDNWALPYDVDVYYFTPTRQSWGSGDREITCMFGSADGETPLRGSLRQDDTTLDADQLEYLRADAVLYGALEGAPEEEYVEEALGEHKRWAQRISRALTEQTGILRDHDWPVDAERPLAGHLNALEEARQEWTAASRASDADAFYEHYEKGYDLLEGPRTVTARKALGLADSPPVYEEESVAEDTGGDASATEV
ncbi:DUF4190 domain-containing protein [Streptomyces sp. NPDC002845]